MNESHLTFLASPQWAAMLKTDLVPWLAANVTLGDDVLEVGPGPGLTTDLLRTQTQQLTAVEIDESLAAALTNRLAGTNVQVIVGDAGSTGFAADRFSAVVSFAVLHHMPGEERQDAAFAEIFRVLAPGGCFAGNDSRDLPGIRDNHAGDVFVPVDPAGLVDRLGRFGFTDVETEIGEYSFFFRAKKPA